MIVNGVNVNLLLWLQTALFFSHFTARVFMVVYGNRQKVLKNVLGTYLALILVSLFNIYEPALDSGVVVAYNGILLAYSVFNFNKIENSLDKNKKVRIKISLSITSLVFWFLLFLYFFTWPKIWIMY